MDDGVKVEKMSTGWPKNAMLAGSHKSSKIYIVSDKLYKLSPTENGMDCQVLNSDSWTNSLACFLYENLLYVVHGGIIKTVDVESGQVSNYYTNTQDLLNFKSIFVSHYDKRVFVIKEDGLYTIQNSKLVKEFEDLELKNFKNIVINQSNVYFSTTQGDLKGLYEGQGKKFFYLINRNEKISEDYNAHAQFFIGGFVCFGKEKITLCHISDMCFEDKTVTFSEENGNLGQVVNYGAVNCDTRGVFYVLYETGNLIKYTF